jgi:hypothetical protein
MDRDHRSLTVLELVMLAAVAARSRSAASSSAAWRRNRLHPGVPQKIVPPTWFVALDYLALFLLYFVACSA